MFHRHRERWLGLALFVPIALQSAPAQACSATPCWVRMCGDEPAAGIALVHTDESTRKGYQVTLVVDAVLRPRAGLNVGTQLEGSGVSGSQLYVALLDREFPTVADRVFGVNDRGLVDCTPSELCQGKPGLTPQQLADLNGSLQCRSTVKEAGYTCPPPFDCGGCAVARPPAAPARWLGGLGALAAVLALRRRRRRA
jgi:MYXO-CTERM domain-containing protein